MPAIGHRWGAEGIPDTDIRSWHIRGFLAVLVYYTFSEDTILIWRILQGARDVDLVLKQEIQD